MDFLKDLLELNNVVYLTKLAEKQDLEEDATSDYGHLFDPKPKSRTVDIYHDPGGTEHGPEIHGPLYIDPTYSLADAAGTTSDFDLYAALEGREKARFADDQMITTGNRFIAANGGRIPYAYGGVIGSDGRRAYGLGSFVKKAFKKAKRAVKKIAKSPIGKAAIIGGLGYLTMGGASGAGFFQKPWAQALKAGWKGTQGPMPSGFTDLLYRGAGWAAKNKLPLALIGGTSLVGGLSVAGQEDESLDNYIAGRTGTGINPSPTYGTPGPCGSLRYFGGGGGGGHDTSSPGAAGVGGGGKGAKGPYPAGSVAADAGTVNTGGGAGGANGGGPSVCAKAGGSGVVIIRYKFQ